MVEGISTDDRGIAAPVKPMSPLKKAPVFGGYKLFTTRGRSVHTNLYLKLMSSAINRHVNASYKEGKCTYERERDFRPHLALAVMATTETNPLVQSLRLVIIYKKPKEKSDKNYDQANHSKSHDIASQKSSCEMHVQSDK